MGITTRTNEAYSPSDQLTGLTTTYQILGLTLNNNPTSFTYAGLTNTERTASGSTTYQNGPEGLANQTASNATTSFTRDPSGTLVSERVGGQSYYYLFDSQGSVVGLVNSSGAKVNSYSYDPYGQSRSASEQVANPQRFTGGYLDSTTGLYHLGARYYDPTLGRFSQLDPSGQTAGYAYAGDDPVNLTDPSGEGVFGDLLAVGGAALTVAGYVGLATAAAAGGPVTLGAALGLAAGAGVSAGGLLCTFGSSC